MRQTTIDMGSNRYRIENNSKYRESREKREKGEEKGEETTERYQKAVYRSE